MKETWLSANDVQNHPVVSEFEKHGYNFHHRPRCSGRGGGGVDGKKITGGGVAVLRRHNFPVPFAGL